MSEGGSYRKRVVASDDGPGGGGASKKKQKKGSRGGAHGAALPYEPPVSSCTNYMYTHIAASTASIMS